MYQQATATSGSVLQLVDVGVEVAQTGGYAANSLARRHPLFAERCKRIRIRGKVSNTRSFHQQPLHLRAGVSFLGCHSSSTNQYTVNRHIRTVIDARPFAGNVVSSTFRGTDTATSNKNQVLAVTHIGVGVQQQIIQRFPRMVATGNTAFNLNDDLGWGNSPSDAHYLANLINSARLECYIRNAVGVQ